MTNQNKKLTIVTHSGTFHADEVFATALILLNYDLNFDDVNVVRTRDNTVLESAIVDPSIFVLDVGRVFDGENKNFDHHQKDFHHPYQDDNRSVSTLTLINDHFNKTNVFKSNTLISIMEREISSIDCGIDYHGVTIRLPGITMDWNELISSFNPNWDEENDTDAAFKNAVLWAKIVLDKFIQYDITDLDSIINTVNQLITKREQSKLDAIYVLNEYHKANIGSDVFVMEQYVPWQDWLFESNLDVNFNYVLYPSNGNWNLQCVADGALSFNSKKPFPVEWRGLDADKLKRVTNIDGAVFCHINGFLSVWKTKEDALQALSLLS